jgi:hypothetical protein
VVTPRSVHASLTPKIASSASSTPSKVLTVAPGGTARAVTRATPFGYGPSDLRSAYSLGSASANRGAGQTIAIVDAYDHPNAASDLANFRSTYGLPAANFRKVDQRGGTNYPSTDTGWAEEISLDLDMAFGYRAERQHPAGRGRQCLVRGPGKRCRSGSGHGRDADLQLLRGRRGLRITLRVGLQPSRNRHHGEHG